MLKYFNAQANRESPAKNSKMGIADSQKIHFANWVEVIKTYPRPSFKWNSTAYAYVSVSSRLGVNIVASNLTYSLDQSPVY